VSPKPYVATLEPPDRWVAHQMLAEGRSKADVADYFGLTTEELQAGLEGDLVERVDPPGWSDEDE